MTNKEILAELKQSYEYLLDIDDNGNAEHCNGQLNAEQMKHIHNAMNELAKVYSSFRKSLDDDEVRIYLPSGVYYIGHSISEDCELYDEEKNEIDFITCGDLDYYWYKDEDFIDS